MKSGPAKPKKFNMEKYNFRVNEAIISSQYVLQSVKDREFQIFTISLHPFLHGQVKAHKPY